MFPYSDQTVMQVTSAFYRKFFGDTSQRVFLIGINPGRFGGGTTGIPFTDPVSLEKQCGITNPFPKRRELSAEFVEALIERFGGPGDFYRTFFITAVSPVGFTKDGKNYNYYDDSEAFAALRPFIVKNLRGNASPSRCGGGAGTAALRVLQSLEFRGAVLRQAARRGAPPVHHAVQASPGERLSQQVRSAPPQRIAVSEE
jgi:hypothetical protein